MERDGKTGRIIATWTEEQDNLVRSLYETKSRAEIARSLNRTVASIRARCMILGLNTKKRKWTDLEIAEIQKAYAAPQPQFLIALSTRLGVDKHTISRKARALGLSNRKRDYGGRKPKPRKYATNEEFRKATGERMKKHIAENGHPRGSLGMKHTEATKARISQTTTAYNQRITPDERERIRKQTVETMLARYGRGSMVNFNSSNPYSRTRSGKRKDLGDQFFRSAWEANYARYLNFLISKKQIASWQYEPQAFVFHGITRGVISYTPDFKVYENDGSYRWHEVKGWMDPKSKAKLKRMAKFYPNEIVIIIGKDEYKAINPFSRLIEGWEDDRR